jgi:hypothetical protein
MTELALCSFQDFARLGAAERAFLMSRHAISTYIQYYLGDSSPVPHPNPKIGKTNTRKMREKSNAFRFGWCVAALTALVTPCLPLATTDSKASASKNSLAVPGSTSRSSSPALGASASPAAGPASPSHAASMALGSPLLTSAAPRPAEPQLRIEGQDLELLAGDAKKRVFLDVSCVACAFCLLFSLFIVRLVCACVRRSNCWPTTRQ